MKLYQGNPHIHSHPNLRNEKNEAMAIMQANLTNAAIVAKEEQIKSPREVKKLKVIPS